MFMILSGIHVCPKCCIENEIKKMEELSEQCKKVIKSGKEILKWLT